MPTVDKKQGHCALRALMITNIKGCRMRPSHKSSPRANDLRCTVRITPLLEKSYALGRHIGIGQSHPISAYREETLMKLASLSQLSAVAYTTALVATAAAPSYAQPASQEASASNVPAPEAAPPPKPARAEPETPPGPPPSENPSYFHATEVQYLHGWRYKEPTSDPHIQKNILTFQHYRE